jgi:hypothetical protein
MGEGPDARGPVTPASAGDDDNTVVIDSTVVLPGAVAQHPPTEVVPLQPSAEAAPQHEPTQAAHTHQPTDVVRPPPLAGEVVRYGPGVPEPVAPVGQAGVLAGQIWRTGRPPVPPRRPRRLRRLAGSALTLILLAASGLVLYLRFHHPPFHVTGVAIARLARTGCTVDVTGRIATNGSAGTVSYQWLFQPGAQPPQQMSQSVSTGQHAVEVTIEVDGSGHGSATQTVTLQVLRPDLRSASSAVTVSC